MTPATIRQLNALNRQFYQTTAESFSLTRQRPWDGWQTAWESIAAELPVEKVSVWDVGCGNGRFAEFFRTKLGAQTLEYVGIDSSHELLAEAAKLNGKMEKTEISLSEVDVIEEMLSNDKWDKRFARFDVIVCFGVFHHVPSFELRAKLLKTLASHLNPGGKLIVTFWQFGHNQNLMNRAVSGETIVLAAQDLEPLDFFLTWEREEHAVRYCHWVNEAEQKKLIEITGMNVAAEFVADGKSGGENRYVVVKL